MAYAASIGMRVHRSLFSVTAWQRAEHRLDGQETLIEFIATETPTDPRDARVVVANSLLFELICDLICYHSQQIGGITEAHQKGHGSPVWQIMREHGWCPAQLLPMFSEFTTTGLLFLDNLERPSPWENHQTIQPRENIIRPVVRADDTCQLHRCQFRQLSDDAYQTKHTKECLGLGCVEVVADLDTLCDILQRGKIPLIVSIDSGDETNISLVEAEPGIAYIAISHVWSDGLGNVQRNALRRCQLLRLSNFVRNLPGPAVDTVHFWLDTICVPPDAACRDEAQKMAIKLMRQTYKDATAVLVLDSWLFDSTTHEKSDPEILMKIFSSLWNRRLWTYQEGALAQYLLFQFKDCAYELGSGMDRFNSTDDVAMHISLKSSLNSSYRTLRIFKDLEQSTGQSMKKKLDAVIDAMQFRTTSVATDEALCLAALLDFDMTPILEAKPASRRMEEFWKMTTLVPASILWYRGPTFDKPGLRWAPQTLLLSQSNINTYDGTNMGVESSENSGNLSAQPTSRGLLFRTRGLVFITAGFPIGYNFTVKDENGRCHQLKIDWNEGTPGTVRFKEDQNGTFREALSFNPNLVYNCREVAFIYLEEAYEFDADLQDMYHEASNIRIGILVAISEETNGIIYARKLCYVTIILKEKSFFPGLLPYGSGCKGSHTLLWCVGKTMPTEQQWCVE